VDDAGSSVEATVESSSAETTTESTSAPAPTVENVSKSYEEASNATGDIKASLDQAVSAGRDSDEFAGFDQNNGGELTNLYNAVVGTEIGAVDAETLKDDRTEVSDAAIQLVEDAKRDDRKDDKKFEVDADELLKGQVNTDIKNIETAENNLNDAINVQDTALDELNKKIEITNKFTGTDGFINIETGKIEDATSIPAATESLGAATALKDGADKKFEDSKAAYDKAADDYKTAKDDLKAKQQAYNEALNAAVADDSALAKAKAELETAQKDCETLESKISDAQKALSDSAIGKLASALEKTEKNANDWSSLDLIMKDVIQYYYFPSIGVNAADVVIDPQFTKNSALVDGTKNERANYIKATVKTTDGEKVYYLNYICEKDNTPDNKIDNDGRYPKMVIFEKNPELLGHHYEVEGTDAKYASGDVENDENQVTIEFLKKNATSDSSGKFIIIGETTYHIDDNDNKEVTKVEAGDIDDVSNTDAGRSGSYISDVKEGNTTTEYKDGVLTVKTEGSVTTTTFETGKTLGNIESSESESKSSYDGAVAAAEAARDAAVNNALVAEGHTLQKDENGNDIISSDITVSAKASATATVEYKTKFTTTIDLTKVTAKYDKSPIDLSIGSDKEKGAVVDSVKKLVNDVIEDYLRVNGLYDSNQGFEVSYTNLSKDFIRRNVKLGDNEFTFKNGSSVSFTYYSKASTATGDASDSKANVSDDMSTDDVLKEAKDEALSKAGSVSDEKATNNNSNIVNIINNASVKAYSKKIGRLEYARYATFSLKNGAISTTADVVKVQKNADASVNYNYKVSNIKYADQYDTVEEGKTIYSKEFNLSALTSVDDYADIPLLNDNYYNYKNGNSKEGILADLGDTDSDIYKSLMKDVENANKLAAKYEDARKKAEDANSKVKDAQDKVNKLIESINALRNNSGSEYKEKLAALEAKLTAAQKKLEDATGEKELVDEAYERALAAYEEAVARLTPAPATGDEETSPAGGGTTTPAPATTLATTLAGTPAFTLPLVADAAPAAGVAGARTIRGTAADSDSESTATDTTAKIAPEKEVEEDALAITKDTIKTIKDNETPLSSLTEDSTQKMNWWWLLLIALLGATGEEIYRRNKKKKEEEAALKAEVDKE
ncbi:MAG: hypothetical protein SPE25_09510, partial [Lachnospiraceae bacterium]|nr:hypothetical protein [Lachnospiraceae bacterium]